MIMYKQTVSYKARILQYTHLLLRAVTSFAFDNGGKIDKNNYGSFEEEHFQLLLTLSEN